MNFIKHTYLEKQFLVNKAAVKKAYKVTFLQKISLCVSRDLSQDNQIVPV